MKGRIYTYKLVTLTKNYQDRTLVAQNFLVGIIRKRLLQKVLGLFKNSSRRENENPEIQRHG